MYNYKNKTSFFSPMVPKAWAKKSGFNLVSVHFYIRREPVLIHQIRIGFE